MGPKDTKETKKRRKGGKEKRRGNEKRERKAESLQIYLYWRGLGWLHNLITSGWGVWNRRNPDSQYVNDPLAPRYRRMHHAQTPGSGCFIRRCMQSVLCRGFDHSGHFSMKVYHSPALCPGSKRPYQYELSKRREGGLTNKGARGWLFVSRPNSGTNSARARAGHRHAQNTDIPLRDSIPWYWLQTMQVYRTTFW